MISESETESSTPESPIQVPPPVPAPRLVAVKTVFPDQEEGEPEQELQVEPVVDNDGVTEASMKVVTQIMTMKSARKRKKLIKKSHLDEKELDLVRHFEESMRIKNSFWSCCGGGR